MNSLVSSTASPSKDGASSLPRRTSSFTRPPLRALYDLLIAPMEGVSGLGPVTQQAPSFVQCSTSLGCVHRPHPLVSLSVTGTQT